MPDKPFHIIIADDDDDDQFILAGAIKSFNRTQLKITAVYNGADLLKQLHKAAADPGGILPDVVLLDVNMPVMDGMEALQQIKGDDKLRHLPVFVVTTLRNMDRLEKCLDLGACNFFTKPNHIAGYDRIIEEIMSNILEHS